MDPLLLMDFFLILYHADNTIMHVVVYMERETTDALRISLRNPDNERELHQYYVFLV